MAQIDFPANPTTGQQYTSGGVTWTWDGYKWTTSGSTVAYLPIAGGTMSGPIVLAADPVSALQATTKQYVDAKPVAMGDNRIINGDMRIDQRNNGAGGSAGGYTVDRWGFSAMQSGKINWGRNVGPASALAGFPYFFGLASVSAYTLLASDFFVFYQPIEADMISDFAWGTASAQPVTLSFWAYSNQTGTFSGSVRNYAATRSYPFSFSIPTAGTWTRIVITIPGDTAGTWVMSGNAGSIYLNFDLGSGATYRGAAGAWVNGDLRGATGAVSIVTSASGYLAITGVKLEVGSVATPFNRQSLTKSLADCQRYYQQSTRYALSGYGPASQGIFATYPFPVQMRAAPTVAFNSIAYNNSSGLTTSGPPLADSFVGQLTITALGFGSTTFGFTASAEL